MVIVSATVSAQSPSPSIRSIDFANFTYPYTPGLLLPKDRQRSFALRDGTFPETKRAVGMYFGHAFYGDVTGDGAEEALVYLEVHTNGSAAPGCVYIYRTGAVHPRLLWAFDTGDRHYGGLRQVYADRGDLIVELYGKGKFIGRDLFADDGTSDQTPFPYIITRTRYRWNRRRFRRIGKPIEFSDPEPRSYGIPLFALKSAAQSNNSLDRRERVSHQAWRGEGCVKSRRPVNSDVRPFPLSE
jgi:hypothetical protein